MLKRDWFKVLNKQKELRNQAKIKKQNIEAVKLYTQLVANQRKEVFGSGGIRKNKI